jgi:hypothetical protein
VRCDTSSSQLVEGKADKVAKNGGPENLGGIDARIHHIDERIRRNHQAKERGTKANQ